MHYKDRVVFSYMKIFYFCFYLLLLAGSSVNAKQLIMASDVWCPYICEHTENPGYIVELVQAVFKIHNVDVGLQIIPLARAIKLTKDNNVDMISGFTEEHVETYKLARNQLSVGSFANDFFVYRKNQWRYTSEQKLAEYLTKRNKIGIIKGYVYGTYIDQLIIAKPNSFFVAHGDSPLNQNIQMLIHGRINILLDTRNTVLYEARKNAVEGLVYAGSHGENVLLYIGLSPNFLAEHKKILNDGITEFRNNGKLDLILKKYGITDWQ